MTKPTVSNQIKFRVNNINNRLNEISYGDYCIDDIVRIHDALSKIESELNALVVVDRVRRPLPTSQNRRRTDTAKPTITKDEKPVIKKFDRPSPLDLPHETDLKRRF